MQREEERNARLFSYGTLQYRDVQLATFGRELSGTPDALQGFTLSTIKITNPEVIASTGDTHYPVLRPNGNREGQIEGVIFDLTEAELAAADAYEGADYARVRVRSKSGLETYVYILATDA
jgi:gamma-glutamylcyclotransferase (GGCT)/AIG2-like uncharacterized protein YtfP